MDKVPSIITYHLGRLMPYLDVCESSIQKMVSSKASDIPQRKFGSDDYYSNTTDKEAPTCCNKFNVHCQKGEDCQIYIWFVGLLQAGIEEQRCNRNEIRKYEDTRKLSEFCTNGGMINYMQTTIGELRRVCVLGNAKWTEEEPQTKVCNYVHAMHRNRNNVSERSMYKMPEASIRVGSKGIGGNLFMVVETFVDESVRRNIASSILCDLPNNSSDPEKIGYYYECIVEFGFNHIIVIGEMLNGLLFLDCYGRLKSCKICQEGETSPGDNKDDGKLISPCKCKGSLQYVHIGCLNRWRFSNVRAEASYRCEVCKYE